MKKAFTMIELVFVIVVLGILASVAIPKLTATRVDAVIARGATDVASIRSGIALARGQNLLLGEINKVSKLDADDGNLFGEILTTSITPGTKSGNWQRTSETEEELKYEYKVDSIGVEFIFNIENQTFACDETLSKYKVGNSNYCSDLSK